MENLSEKIKFFQNLKETSNSSDVPKPRLSHNKLQIPSIFVSKENNSNSEKITNDSVESNLSNSENNSAKLYDKDLSKSVDVNLHQLSAEPSPLYKSKSQEVLKEDHTVDNITSNEDIHENNSEKIRNSSGLVKYKACDDLTSVSLDNSLQESTQAKEEAEEVELRKPKVLEIVPKQIALRSTDGSEEFQKKYNQISVNRASSFVDAREQRKDLAKEATYNLYVKKLDEIRSKHRSTDFDSIPRTFIFDFTGRHKEVSKSDNNLNAISSKKLDKVLLKNGNSDANLNSRGKTTEDINDEKKVTSDAKVINSDPNRSPKTIPKEMRMRSIELERQNDNEQENSESNTQEESMSVNENDLSNTIKTDISENLEIEKSESETCNGNVSDNIPVEQPDVPVNQDTPDGSSNSDEITNFKKNYELLTGPVEQPTSDETLEQPLTPVPAPRRVLTPVVADNDDYFTFNDANDKETTTEHSDVDDEKVVDSATHAFDNDDYITSNELHQPEISPRNLPSEEIKPQAAPRHI